MEPAILSVAIFPLSSNSSVCERPWFNTLGSARILSGMKPVLFLIQNQISAPQKGTQTRFLTMNSQRLQFDRNLSTHKKHFIISFPFGSTLNMGHNP